ncbi:AAA family ATPase [Methylobacterium sp. NPDC097213]|uniref:AAA family ATPase n=1 Tax=Methylobacterium sp. NPDC097213 TaxID=3364170 RepID=UPI003839D48E
MTNSPLDEGARACALERYLAGDATAPKRGTFPFAPAALLLTARYGRSIPSLRTAAGAGEDVRVVGIYRAMRLAFDAYAHEMHRDKREAEETLAVQVAAAFDLVLGWLRESGFSIDFDFTYSDEQQDTDEHLRLLAGVLALSLWEVGHPPAREHIRGLLPDLLGGPDGWRYVRASVGLAEDVHAAMDWRPGRGALGSLSNALLRGGRLIEDAYVGAPQPAPTWATAAREKAAAEKAAKTVVESGPSLLVLASTDHLPGLAKAGEGKPGGSVGATPRAAGAPIAGRRLRLVRVPDLAAARATLVAEFPDDVAIVDAILGPLAGRAYVALPPTLLLGPPGTGKSRFARRLGEELGLAVTVYGCAGVSDSSFIGTSRQWSTGRACVPLQAIRRAEAASVLVVLDELSRAGTRADNGKLVDGVLALTERETARAYQDPYLECPVDLSAVSYLATANSRAGLDPALLSRFRVLEMGPRTLASLPALTRAVLADIRAERGLNDAWLPGPDPEEEAVLAAHWRDGSVRTLRQLVEGIVAARDALATRM